MSKYETFTLYTGVPVSKVLAELDEQQDVAEQEPREYILESIPTPRELENMTHLPFEISITSLDDGRLALSTGVLDCVTQELRTKVLVPDLIEERHDFSHVSFHTHPEDEPGSQNGPSLEDIAALSEAENRTMLIGSPEYFMVFHISDSVSPLKVTQFLRQYNQAFDEFGVEFSEEEIFQFFLKEFEPYTSITYHEWDSEEIAGIIQEHFTVVNVTDE